MRQRRRFLNVTQQELADRMTALGYPCSRSWVAQVETGHQRAPLKFRRASAAALDCDLRTLWR